jgi:hypothetical protein
MTKLNPIIIFALIAIALSGCTNRSAIPVNVQFKLDTVQRLGDRGDNWCITWAKDGSQITSMDDGNWLRGKHGYHNNIYRITGDAHEFSRENIPAYPQFVGAGEGWFGYGILSAKGTIYSMVSRTPGPNWDGPFRGIKMLKSSDNGNSWRRVSRDGQERFLSPGDKAREIVDEEEMFFLEEFGLARDGETAYPFSFCSFVQNGQDNSAAKDDYIYIYSPEGAQAHKLLLARVKNSEIGQREKWDYFETWDGSEPVWTDDLNNRGGIYEFPEKNKADEFFGWYSWLPSVVWNPGLNLYIMVNGGTYAGHGLSGSAKDYYDRWMHTKTGSLGFWYSKNPYGPWKQFFYKDFWTVDDEKNRTYQPKLSPKWISKDGSKMVLIWSDAMKNEKGHSHTVNYLWNQMEIVIETKE